MKNFITSFLVFSLTIMSASAADAPCEIYKDDFYKMIMVKKNEERFTKRWAFVIDSSHSTWDICTTVMAGFNAAVSMPTDDLRFCAYTFNNRGCHKFRDWEDASKDAFDATKKWVSQNKGVNSYVEGAIRGAITQPVENLTVILISDGGFSDGVSLAGASAQVVKEIIAEAQAERANQGLPPAIICTIGIENARCWPQYPKASNATCMQGMRDIGIEGRGGFFYVREIAKELATAGKK